MKLNDVFKRLQQLYKWSSDVRRRCECGAVTMKGSGL